ncbi:hypothetical protein SpCBS45565_g05499 [Spizellomyces sp. 'palustris']|nr:hypothetical protein SpCBS45565_g05499 [Spizellomyces sp. 'palustris']
MSPQNNQTAHQQTSGKPPSRRKKFGDLAEGFVPKGELHSDAYKPLNDKSLYPSAEAKAHGEATNEPLVGGFKYQVEKYVIGEGAVPRKRGSKEWQHEDFEEIDREVPHEERREPQTVWEADEDVRGWYATAPRKH